MTLGKRACGCGPTHRSKCLSRGRDKMSESEIETDLAAELEEEAAEEGRELVKEVEQKGKNVAMFLRAAVASSGVLRPMMPIKEIADELRQMVTTAEPLLNLLEELGEGLLSSAANVRARVIKQLVKDGFSEDASVKIVLSASADIASSIKASQTTTEKK